MTNETSATPGGKAWSSITDKARLHEYLKKYEQEGDEYADTLAGEVLGKKGNHGRLEYNKLLILFNKLSEHPGLMFAPNSEIAREIEKYAASKDPTDKHLAEYFQPIKAPAWVNPGKLALAAKLWRENTIVSLGALYAASLPSCYLIKYGIPALYDSKRLLGDYLPQRIYETGLFVEAVLDEGGFSLVRDEVFDITKVVDGALDSTVENWAKEDGATWIFEDGSLFRLTAEGKQNARDLAGEPWQDLKLKPGLPAAWADKKWYEAVELAIVEKLESRPRYLLGKGYMTAKKVRFYHAAMRHMLLHAKAPSAPGSGRARDSLPWNSERLGAPVNQLDQAYTLLTFGMDIPRGLEKWGVALSAEEKAAFLHLWKLVGHVIGIDEELLTDDWQEAEKLYSAVREMRGGGSPDGVALTTALVDVLQDYLPRFPGTDQNCAPIELIISLMGLEDAKLLIPEKDIKDARTWWRRVVYKLAGFVCKLYFKLRSRWLKRLPALGQMTAGVVNKAGGELVESWRDAYRRQPFFIPKTYDSMERLPGADKEFLQKLKDWRGRVLTTAGVGLGLLGAAVLALSAAFPLWLIAGQGSFLAALGVSVGSWLLFNHVANKRLQDLLDQRPKTAGQALKVQIADADAG